MRSDAADTPLLPRRGKRRGTMKNELERPLRRADVFETSFDEVVPGLLARKFREGAALAVVECRPQMARAWQTLLLSSEERLPWDTRLVDIARNHHPGDLVGQIGDMFYFSVNRLAYIARKFELRRGRSGDVECVPEFFVQPDGRRFSIDTETRRDCWEFADRIMASMIANPATAPPFEVVVHRIKYERMLSDIEKICSLSRNAVGKWAQLGCAVDEYREDARGPLARKGVCDLFALLSLLRPIRGALRHVNGKFEPSDIVNSTDERFTLIGKPHCDGRYFSALCGDRESIRTEAWMDGRWVELPIGLDHVVVLPGLLAEKHFGIRPVMHRILHSSAGVEPRLDAPTSRREGPTGRSEEPVNNVTLLFGAKEARGGRRGDRARSRTAAGETETDRAPS